MGTGYSIHLTDNMRYGKRKPLFDFVCHAVNSGNAADAEKANASAINYLKGKLEKYAGVSISDLAKDKVNNSNLVIYPPDLTAYVDDVEKSCLFELPYVGGKFRIETGNLMGAFGIGDIKISIGSRFDERPDKPYFMHYILMKVLGLHVLNLPTHENYDPIDAFCIFLFPMVLKSALAKGLFKAYRRYEYNDANIKGAIDVARHLRTSVPFRGRVAYVTREHTADNPILQLARHAIEFVKAGPYCEILTTADKDVKEAVDQVVVATPTYMRQQRSKVIGQNLRPVRHPYFSEYTLLQKISLQILRHEKMSHGTGSNELAGVVFDGAWLWEEYLNKVMSESLNKAMNMESSEGNVGKLLHPRNKAGENRLHIYESSRHPIYPDFLWRYVQSGNKNQEWDVVLDAKYKRAYKEDDNGKEHFAVAREDRFQMISYMHLTKARLGVIVCPMIKNETPEEGNDNDSEDEFLENEKGCYYVEGYMHGHGGSIAVIPFVVPAASSNFEQYYEDMKKAEACYCYRLSKLILSHKNQGRN